MRGETLYGTMKRFYRRLPSPPSSNYIYRNVSISPYADLGEGAVILDIGAKTARGKYAFGSPPEGAKVLALDIEEGPGVDIVADAHNMPVVEDNSVDCVITVSTLEHVVDPFRVMEEVYRVLKPGGYVYVSVPFIFPFHADPSDYYRFSAEGVDLLCKRFEKLESGFNRGPASTFHEVAIRFFPLLFSFRSSRLYAINVVIFKWLLFWVKYLDKFMASHPDAKVLHNGSYFLGRKPN